MQLILSTCNPTKRLISWYTHMRFSIRNKTTYIKTFRETYFDKYLKLKPVQRAVRSGDYTSMLSKWLEYFPMSKIHIVDAETFKVMPIVEIRKIDQFLGLPSLVNASHIVYNNKTGFYCKRLSNADVCLPPHRKGRHHTPVDEKYLQIIDEYYKPKNHIFFKMIGRMFDWNR